MFIVDVSFVWKRECLVLHASFTSFSCTKQQLISFRPLRLMSAEVLNMKSYHPKLFLRGHKLGFGNYRKKSVQELLSSE